MASAASSEVPPDGAAPVGRPDPDVEDLLEHSAEKFGAGSAVTMNSPSLALGVRSWTSTGSLALDLAIGGPHVPGGIPTGRIVEIRGETSEGKSLILYHLLANNQKAGGISILFDTEEATAPSHAVDLGVNPDTLVMPQPKTMDNGIPRWTVEEIVERVESYLTRLYLKWRERDGEMRPLMIGWDSVAQTPSKYESEQAPGDENYMRTKVGDHAKSLSTAFRRLPGLFMRLNASMVCINQLRGGPPKRPGLPEPKTSLGGRALGFAASVRIEVSKLGDVYDKADPKTRQKIGIDIEAEVFKNKISRPFRCAMYRVYFETGICDVALMPDQLVNWGAMTKTGGTRIGAGMYQFPSATGLSPKGMRLDSYLETMERNQVIRDALRDWFRDRFKLQEALSPVAKARLAAGMENASVTDPNRDVGD